MVPPTKKVVDETLISDNATRACGGLKKYLIPVVSSDARHIHLEKKINNCSSVHKK